jgi:hypothetical protein
MRWTIWIGMAAIGGCGGDKGEPGSCEPVTAGTWTMGGSCLGMSMPTTLSVDADGCSFTLGDWTMAMDVPEGGTVTDSEVTLSGSGWDDCTGTLAGDSIEGTCADGCSFTLEASGA